MIKRKIKNLSEALITKKHIKDFFKEYKRKELNEKRILIYAGIGHSYMSYFEILLYHLLIKEGYTVDFLVYDNDIQINEFITKKVFQTQGKDKYWKKNVRNTKKLHEIGRVNYKIINANKDIVNKEVARNSSTLESIFSYKIDGINLGNTVQNTMYKFYRSMTFGNDALSVAKKLLHTTLTNYFEVKERVNNNNYQYIMFSHGIYVTWEPIVKFCESNNIDFIAYDRAKSKGTININFNQVSPDWSFNKSWKNYINKPLKIQEKEKVYNYLKDRELQLNDVYAYNFSKRSNNVTLLKQKLNIPLDSKVITVFTNLIWDAANVARDLAFENAFDCLIKTIDYYSNKKGVHILLRSHPAEKIIGTKERYGELLKKHFNNNLPKNVTIIEPEMAINSFSVIDISDIGVVNTSTVGLEFALLGKPIILISETHYRNKGFTYDIDDEKEYYKLLDKLIIKSELKENQVKLAEKYFYMMMFEYQHKLPLEYKDGKFIKYLAKNVDEIANNPIIENIIGRIVEGKNEEFIFWDC